MNVLNSESLEDVSALVADVFCETEMGEKLQEFSQQMGFLMKAKMPSEQLDRVLAKQKKEIQEKGKDFFKSLEQKKVTPKVIQNFIKEREGTGGDLVRKTSELIEKNCSTSLKGTVKQLLFENVFSSLNYYAYGSIW